MNGGGTFIKQIIKLKYINMIEKQNKLSTEPYKGVRDFYPEDKFIQDYIFGVWRKTAESFGYIAYDASILEPTELYKAKSGEEIINEQTYSFKDRGDREVTLRPEMTPTVARMIAGKRREIKFPQRWYSIPNLFRYERPQRGRLREHWQLNCDMFGVSGIEAEVEMIALAYNILVNFAEYKYGTRAKQFVNDNFEIKINYSGLLNSILVLELDIDEKVATKLIKIIDKKGKVDEEQLNKMVVDLIGDEKTIQLNKLLVDKDEILSKMINDSRWQRCKDVKDRLNLQNSYFDSWLTRGFDYYTGIVFEIYDKNPANPRALFGGGRYDNLLSIFGEEPIPTIGFGMGDVTIRDVLETYELLPEYKSSTEVAVLPFSSDLNSSADTIANMLREKNINVAVDYSDKKIGDKIGKADKEKIRYVIVVGENEIKEGLYTLKELSTKIESKGNIEELCSIIVDTNK